MNYRIFLVGHMFQTYHDCIKLLTYSASQSDYVVDIEGFEKNTPYSPLKNYILLKGSSKNIYSDIVIDFDDLVGSVGDDKTITVSPSTIEAEPAPDAVHYWKAMGVVFKIISDLSPAYVTGYLLEKNMKKELEAFNGSLSRLPFAIQIAINELMTDID